MSEPIAYLFAPPRTPPARGGVVTVAVAGLADTEAYVAKVGPGGSFVLDVGDTFEPHLDVLARRNLGRVVVVLPDAKRTRDAFRLGAVDVLVGAEVEAEGAFDRAYVGRGGSRRAQLFEMAWEASPTGLVVLDGETQTATVNPSAAGGRGYGYLMPGVTPTLRDEAGNILPLDQFPLVRGGRGERIEDMRIILDTPGAAEGRHLAVTARPLLDGLGVTRGGVVASRDITDRVLQERHGLGLELQAESFAKCTPDVLLTIDQAGTILAVNPAVYDMLGYEPSQLVGQPLQTIIPDDLRERHVAAFSRYLATSKRTMSWSRIALPALHQVGHLVPVEASFGEYTIAGKRFFTGTLRDATDARRTESRRAMESSRLTALVTSLQAGILVENELGRVVLTNHAFVDALCPEASVGSDGEEIHTKLAERTTDPSHFLARVAAMLAARELVTNEVVELRDGTVFERDYVPIVVDDEYRGHLWSYVDVTDRRRSEATIMALNGELETRAVSLDAVNRELEAFSYSVSHDLRAPLRSIHGFAAALAEDYSATIDAEGRQYLDRIMAAAARMGLLIDDLIELSRISRSKLVRAPVDLTAMAHSITSDLLASDPSRKVELRIAEGLVAEGDASLLRSLLENLLGNSFKYSRNVELAIIELFAEARDGETVFVVRDNGAGFDMAHAGRLFSAFERLHSKSDFEGTGIGLASAHRVVSKHGGRIFADARPGHGATFSFTLPGVGKVGPSL